MKNNKIYEADKLKELSREIKEKLERNKDAKFKVKIKCTLNLCSFETLQL